MWGMVFCCYGKSVSMGGIRVVVFCGGSLVNMVLRIRQVGMWKLACGVLGGYLWKRTDFGSAVVFRVCASGMVC